MTALLLSLVALVPAARGALALARNRWRATTAAMVERLHEGAAGPSRSGGAPALDGLPAPVARYFEAVLPDAP